MNVHEEGNKISKIYMGCGCSTRWLKRSVRL